MRTKGAEPVKIRPACAPGLRTSHVHEQLPASGIPGARAYGIDGDHHDGS